MQEEATEWNAMGEPDNSGLDDMTFEQLVSELEAVASAMDRGDIGIEEAADLYGRAGALHAAAAARLAQVQHRLALLRGDAPI